MHKAVKVETLQWAGLLITNRNDIIHKAVGWMLREIAARNQVLALSFLKKKL